ncbi:MAG: signal peptidase II [Methylobacterium sp.]|uniref:signal peptidase II n=1 Tax=Methylobacterium sp. TaxID=409 RepID=UPI0025DB7551|nr:signal peptidase II [Methylobacterium sp.]MBX9934320.1 signal peptidase II [Methylobacterium sp.]
MLRYGLLLAAAWFIVDHGTKWWIREWVMDPPRVIPVTDFFNLVLGSNTGVSFGILGAAGLPPFVLSFVSFAIALALLVWLARTRDRLVATALGLLIGGALANGLDRLLRGAVTDFLDFHVAGWHWPAFNMADIGVVCGAALLVLDSLRSGDVTSPQRAPARSNPSV